MTHSDEYKPMGMSSTQNISLVRQGGGGAGAGSRWGGRDGLKGSGAAAPLLLSATTLHGCALLRHRYPLT